LPLDNLAPIADVPSTAVAAPVKAPVATAAEGSRADEPSVVAARAVPVASMPQAAASTPPLTTLVSTTRNEEPASARAPARPVFEPVNLALPPDFKLELVETRHAATPAKFDEEAEAPRPKRVRPPRVEMASEPLQMVETHHKSLPPND
jgi:hypothetical protein